MFGRRRGMLSVLSLIYILWAPRFKTQYQPQQKWLCYNILSMKRTTLKNIISCHIDISKNWSFLPREKVTRDGMEIFMKRFEPCTCIACSPAASSASFARSRCRPLSPGQSRLLLRPFRPHPPAARLRNCPLPATSSEQSSSVE